MPRQVFTYSRLVLLAVWTSICGPASGITMGLVFLIYNDGRRKGILPYPTRRDLSWREKWLFDDSQYRQGWRETLDFCAARLRAWG